MKMRNEKWVWRGVYALTLTHCGYNIVPMCVRALSSTRMRWLLFRQYALRMRCNLSQVALLCGYVIEGALLFYEVYYIDIYVYI